jgi:hypothetical protein
MKIKAARTHPATTFFVMAALHYRRLSLVEVVHTTVAWLSATWVHLLASRIADGGRRENTADSAA